MLETYCSKIAKFVLILLVIPLFFVAHKANAQTSTTINFQGKIVRNDTGYEGLNVTTGSPACVASGADTCDFQIKYYSASTAGTLYLTETFTDKEIGDYQGIFNLSLGSGTMTAGTYSNLDQLINGSNSIYVEILFSPAGNSTFTETFSRMPLQAVPFAIRSKYAEMAKGAFKFENAANSTGYTGSNGMVYYDTTDSTLKLYAGGTWTPIATGGSSIWQSASISAYSHSPSQFLETTGIATLANFGVDTSVNRAWVHGASSRTGFSVYSNYGGATDWPLVTFKADASNFSNSILQLIQDGTGSILEGYKGSNRVLDFDNRGDLHLSSDGVMYFEPFTASPTNLYPASGEGCLYNVNGTLYWDSACAYNGVELATGSSSLWTDGGTFTYLTSTTDDIYFGGDTLGTSTFVFDIDASGGNYLEIDNALNTQRLFTIDANGNVGIGKTTPSQALDLVGSMNLQNTTTPTTGVIYKGGASFIHNFQHPTGDTVAPAGRNTFIGEYAGNFTMGSTATSSSAASYNTVIGNRAFVSNTTGNSNVASGYATLYSNTTGNSNVASGYAALYANTTGSNNVASGRDALRSNTTGSNNVASGHAALYYNTTGYSNVASGHVALYSNTTGAYNVASGYQAGRFLADGSTGRTTGNYGTYLGVNTKASADGTSNEIVIGYDATGLGSNTVVLGNDSITKTALKGNVGIGTTTPPSLLSVGSTSQFQVSSTGDIVKIKNLTYLWPSAHTTNGILINNGSGTLSWSTITSLGGITGTGSGTATAGQITFWNSSTSVTGDNGFWWDNSTKRLGIGTNTPQASLDIAGATSEISNTDGDITILPAGNLIVSQGNVGIGTTAPSAKLNLSETTGTVHGVAQGSILVDHENSGGASSIVFRSRVNRGSDYGFIQYQDAATVGGAGEAARLIIGTSNDPDDHLILQPSGNVGIGTTGPTQKLDLVGSMNLENTTSSTTGVIYKNGVRFIHNFQHPTGGGAIPVGRNTFIGEVAGNFTMGSTATSTAHGSYNTGIGYAALYSNTTGHENVASGNSALRYNTTGYSNVASGFAALYSNTTGYSNVASGNRALYYNTTGYYNVASGYQALYSNTTGNQNVASGYAALYSNTTGYANVASGRAALYSNTTGHSNVASGYNAGRYLADGSTVNQASTSSIFLGSYTKAYSAGNSNQIVIGYNAAGLGSNTVVLGNDSITTTALKGNVGIGTTSPLTRAHVVGVLGVGYPAITTTFANSGDAIELVTDTTFGGVHDSHTGVRMFAYDMNGWGTAKLGIQTSTNWGTYETSAFFGNDVSYISGNVGIGTTTASIKLAIGDSDTGLHWSADGNLDLYTNNAAKLKLRATSLSGFTYGGYSANLYTNNCYNSTCGVDGFQINGNGFVKILAGTLWTGAYNGITYVQDAGIIFSLGSQNTGGFVIAPHGSSTGGIRIAGNTGYVGVGVQGPYYRLELPNTADIGGRGRANSWTTYSDITLKERIVPLENSLEKILQLNPVSYYWTGTTNQDSGFIAQWIEPIIPYVVSTGGDGIKSIDYGKITPYLAGAIQELNAKVDTKFEDIDKILNISTIESKVQIVTTPGWYRISQLNNNDYYAKIKINNSTLGSSQNLILSVDTVGGNNNVNVISNFTTGGYDINKARINNVGGIKYLEIYLGEVNSNSIKVSMEGDNTNWIATNITKVEDGIGIVEYAFNGVLFGISDNFAVSEDGISTSGTLLTSGLTSNIGNSGNRWNDIYTKGTIRLGSGNSEGGIRYNIDKKRLEFSNDGINWVEMGDLASNMVISPEYSGAILYADGSDNNGRMISDAISTNGVFKNYYEWISDKPTLQDYDILVRITLPSDFVSWKENAISLDFMTENSASTSNNKVEIALMGDSGIDTEVKDGISKMPGAWERISIKSTDITECNKAGDSCTLKLSMYSKENYYVRVGDISLSYNRGL